ncbi:TPA: transporter, partial [Vibrio cholerae O1]
QQGKRFVQSHRSCTQSSKVASTRQQ